MSVALDDSATKLQGVLQQRNFLRYVKWTVCKLYLINTIQNLCKLHIHVHVYTILGQVYKVSCSLFTRLYVLYRNLNPRDPMNINLRKAFLEYDKSL